MSITPKLFSRFSIILIISMAYICSFELSTASQLDSSSQAKQYTEQTWGVALSARSASIIFEGDDDVVTSFVPLLYFKGERFYLDGLEGGFHLYKKSSWQATILGRLRFFDIPEEYQNEVRGDTVDIGGRLRYLYDDEARVDFEILSDQYGNTHANLRLEHDFEAGSLEITPYINARLKSSGFNDRYYGLVWLGNDSIDGGVDFQVGSRLRYHLLSNLYLVGALSVRWLDDSVRDTEMVDTNWEAEVFAGLGIFNEEPKKRRANIGMSPYLRISQGWGTPSSIGDIVSADITWDEYNNQMTALFYGYPLTERLFGLPLELYLTPGIIFHYSSEVQNSAQEYVVAIKAYYTLKLPVRFRFGIAEGLSYISEVTYVESTTNKSGGYETSNLMNYLGFSVDMNIGDIFRSELLGKIWLGVALHHRSSMFESAQQFGRIDGGSNYPSLYLQGHF